MGEERTIVSIRPASSGEPETRDELIQNEAVSEETLAAEAQPDEVMVDEHYDDSAYWEEETAPKRRWIVPSLIGLAALAWTTAAAFGWYGQYGLGFPGIPALVNYVGMAAVPLALLALIYVIAAQSSRLTATRFAETAARLREESGALTQTVTTLSSQIDNQREALHEQANAYSDLADKFHRQMDAASSKLGVDIAALDERATKLKDAATTARADMAILLAGLPKAHSQTRGIANDLREAGLSAEERSTILGTQLAALQQQAVEANEVANSAATRLAAQLSRMEDVSKAASKRLIGNADAMTASVEDMVEKATHASDRTRQMAEEQAANMAILVEEHGTAFRATGEETSAALTNRLSDLSASLDDFASRLSAQDKAGQDMAETLGATLTEMQDRLSALGEHGGQQFAGLTAGVEQLRHESAELDQGFAASEGRIEALSERAGTLLGALDANAREIDETLPAAFARLSSIASESLEGVNARLPDLERFDKLASSAAERLDLASEVLGVQVSRLDKLIAELDDHLESSAKRVDGIISSIGEAEREATRLSDEVAPKVAQSLAEVRAHSDEARNHAQKTLDEVVPQAHAAISAAVSQTLGPDLEALITARIGEVESASQRAVHAASSAVNALQGDIDKLDATSQAIRDRADTALGDVEETSRDIFSRRVALLIEALNSTAIDVTKVFSIEVSDTAWAAYLKGDRGVFTRRAVKLLDGAESKDIARRYEEDYEFRDLVSRYIHDFEAILRTVLTARDGSPMAVTMLSSDMGKLYVALAQAIDRLRD